MPMFSEKTIDYAFTFRDNDFSLGFVTPSLGSVIFFLGFVTYRGTAVSDESARRNKQVRHSEATDLRKISIRACIPMTG